MKKIMMIAAAVALMALTGCGSLRTPTGANNNKIWYNTFFGISIESLVYGDGLLVNQK
ncbi:MAG: hypothetical protein J6X55_02980 [Victivallales bacterium]|nr:hypothetical protein [Victivallales bacterium]